MIVLYFIHPGLFINVGRKRVSWQSLRLIYYVNIFTYVEHRTPFVLLFSEMSLGKSDKDIGTKLQRRKVIGHPCSPWCSDKCLVSSALAFLCSSCHLLEGLTKSVDERISPFSYLFLLYICCQMHSLEIVSSH